jgi:hypothetical protein
MEAEVRPISLPSGMDSPTEAPMIREEVVREMLARLARGEGIKRIARELGVDRKTVKAWRRRGGWRPRPPGSRRRALEAFAPFIEARAPEVGWNSVVLHRELQTLGFTGGYLQVQRHLQPLRAARQWAALATVRFETGPGEQARSTSGSSASGSASRRPCISLSSPWATRGGCGRAPIRTNGWMWSSTATSERSVISVACR